ncbi:MAG: lipopolysaccharide heptosyltransferase II [Candidatus Omnitrophota bacterium]
MKKFLIINPFGIGDVLFTTPLIRALKEEDPQNQVSYWCNERTRGILENNPSIECIFALNRGDLKKIYRRSFLEGTRCLISLMRQIKKEKFDTVFDFSLDHRYALVCQWVGIKQRIGFNFKLRGRFLTDKIDIEGYHDKPMVEHYAGLLRLAGVGLKTARLELFVSEESKDKAKLLLERAGIKDADVLIGIAPGAGASWGKDASLKHWPALQFAQLADRIIENFGVKIIILGDASEEDIAQVLTAGMKQKSINLTGKTSLEELMGVMTRLKLLVTNDGGLLHMGVALGLKTVSIFGPVSEAVYGPYPVGEHHQVVKKDIPCRPCYKNFRMPLCERDRACLKSITVDEVFDAARRLL